MLWDSKKLFENEKDAWESLILSLQHKQIDINSEFRAVARRLAAVEDALSDAKKKGH